MSAHQPPPVSDPQYAFRQSVLAGLQARPKRLSSMYFYDAAGDALFQQIMRMPEYYLTNCEQQIFETEREALLEAFGSTGFDLIELGAGDGTKTKILLEYFIAQGVDVHYMPVDISGDVLQQLTEDLAQRWPTLSVASLQGDYFDMLGRLPAVSPRPRVILFLGANIGNYELDEARQFLKLLRTRMRLGDRLLVGFDLKKDPAKILAAYNDPAGITAAFNLNILHRMNRELGADFDVSQFKHWESYNPLTGDTRSFLVSLCDQVVQFSGGIAVEFTAWEAIRVELSKKYSLPEIQQLGEDVGFSTGRCFMSKGDEFTDCLWERG